MTEAVIEQQFREKVCAEVSLRPEGVERFRVETPFMSDDGDLLAVILRREAGQWLLSDEGHTYMHLTLRLEERDLRQGTRQKIIANALAAFGVADREGELVLPVRDEDFGDALWSFVQALLRINDVSYLTRERVRSTFMEDFRSFIAERVPESRRVFDWHDRERDPEGNYVVDCRINGMPQPLLVFALQSDGAVRDATISLLQFERWGIPFSSVAIFEDQEAVGRRVLARYTDAGDKMFSNLAGNKDRIEKFLADALA
jgi:hypothetical protein